MTEDEMAAEIESLKGRLHAALNFGRAWMDKSKKADVTIADLRKQLVRAKEVLHHANVDMSMLLPEIADRDALSEEKVMHD